MRRFDFFATTLFAIALLLAPGMHAQALRSPETAPGQITGTVTDVNGNAIVGASVILTGGPESADQQTVLSTDTGFFQLDALAPMASYNVTIHVDGFADWTSQPIAVEAGQVKSLGNISLRIATQNTTMQVNYDPVEFATEQIKDEEKQRIFGIIPNFYISFDGENAAPLTPKMKFDLALKVSYDPFSIAGVGFIAGLRQAFRTPSYRQGAKGYGERFAATGVDGFTDIMIGGAILPSVLHQDPRYFYQGTGTARSRLRHAVLSAFIAKGDNGKWQPNYSSVGGDLASAGLSNLYFPKANRGGGLVLSLFALGTGERIASNLTEEFILAKFTHRRREPEAASAQ
jgi:hypothetical protein